ncbi:hypothetical protein JYU34_010033 [Plutella xylostella]|uniref:Uncharacterized protein n=1 Tax=Plutella xylostella TaxID=51655 RepID=A0ABQ7QHJ0_PLUXY|nr:hypothetical protein JYU34_010033 [Plutella xylostella]
MRVDSRGEPAPDVEAHTTAALTATSRRPRQVPQSVPSRRRRARVLAGLKPSFVNCYYIGHNIIHSH